MIVERSFTPGLAEVAYYVADEAAGEVAIIDPRRDIDEYLAWITRHGMRLVAICETHVHADFVSGARELAAATGAPVYAGMFGETEFPHTAVEDGQEIRIGSLTLKALWSPGHTPEHIAYLLFDPELRSDPVAMFSGDILFAGEIGRPDLLGEEAQKKLIEQLYDTIYNRLKPLPDGVVVYPGHTAGSPCGKKIGDAPNTTMGQEKTFGYAFNQPDKASFIKVVMEGMPKPPAYYPFMKWVNKVGPALLAELPGGKALTVREVELAQAGGALLIDARPAAAFAAGHIPAAVAVGLGESFAIWAGWLTPYNREVVLVVDSHDEFIEARTELRRIGIDKIAGWLDGGMTAWVAAGKPVKSVETVSVRDLVGQLKSGDVTLLDVRDAAEWDEAAIAGSRNFSAGRIAQGGKPDLDGGKVAVLCGGGFRSMVAASLLQAAGMDNVVNVEGGINAWREAGLPTGRN